MKKSLFIITFGLLLIISAFGQSSEVKYSKDETEIRRVFNLTAEGWNKGDLPQYLAYYTKEATEMLSTGPKGGVEAIEETMKKGFWKNGRPEQVLRYEHLVVRMIDKKGALVTGQYVLSGAGKPDRTGWFTTVWIKTKEGWRMIHDHS
jgi:uncharacterized protein (TIGR02246 family)